MDVTELKVKAIKGTIEKSAFYISKMRTDNEKAVRCSFLTAQKIAQNMKPYSDGNFVKQCFTVVAEEMCPKIIHEYEKICYELRKEVTLFLKNKGQAVAEMEDESWLCDLAFLVDIATHMNDLNARLQRQAHYANEMYGHIKGFTNKFRLWQAHIQNANLCHFSTLKKTGKCPEKKTEFADQLEKLLNEFLARFKDFKSHEHFFEIFSSPFHTHVDKAPADLQMELVDLQKRADLKAKVCGNESW